MGLIFDIKRFALHDGPGIRTTVFLKGCQMSCLWCHNPEGQTCTRALWHSPARCIDCRSCQRSCPERAIDFSSERLILDREACTLCGLCVEICPTRALEISGREMSAKAIAAEVVKDRVFYDTSGGGLTLSGGDPLYQHRFAGQILRQCRSAGIHTAVETSLYASWAVVEELLPATDLFLVDVKVADPAEHARYTGVANDLVWENLEALLRQDKTVVARIPLIPGFTTTDQNLRALAARLFALDRRFEVELVNYNPYGESKYRRLGRAFLLGPEAKPLPDAEVARLRGLVEAERRGGGRTRPATKRVVAALDIGGTKTKLALYRDAAPPDPEDSLEVVLHEPTPQDPEKFLRLVEEAFRAIGPVDGVGIGCPGPLDQRAGEVLSPPALPFWDRFPITSALAERLGVPVVLENDGNAGALGEAVFGSARGFDRVFYMTISTGIGTGIVIDRRVYQGARGLAGEIWAFDPEIFHGRGGDIINDIASGSGLVKQAQRHGIEAAGAGARLADARQVMAAAAAGDAKAAEIVEGARDALAAALAFVICLLDPDVIVLGGGMCRRPEEFVEPVAVRVRERVRIERLREVPVRRAALWDDAVLYGAVALISQRLEV
jgi:pyruvate formate lyase activating enzyme